MGVRRFASAWRLWGLAACSGALLTGSLFSPATAHSQQQPAGGDIGAETDPVTFESWYNPIDATVDYGPLAVCFSGDHPPTTDFVDQLMEQLYLNGLTPESYHLVHPDGQAMNNRFEFPGRIGPNGIEREPVIFTWWEHDGDGGGGADERYWLGSRWSGAQGSPRALTWSLAKDGINIPGAIGEAASPNILFSRMDTLFASQGGRATWIQRIQDSFNRWSVLTGLSYTRVSQAPNGDGNNDDDDGAAFSGSGGSAGLRGDLRVAMHNIDGTNGVLAYTFFPSNGDMVFDSSENWASTTNQNRFFRDTFMHEHGHGIGMSHVCSNNASFLMEPFLNTAFDGPQHDDIRGAQRHYGDEHETDDSSGTAFSLGTIALGTTNNTACNLPAPQTGTNPANTTNCSIDANGEQDYFSFAVTGSAAATITVTPVGFSYDDNAQASNGSCPSGSTTNSLTRANLAVQLIGTNGTTVLATADAAAAGSAETINSAGLGSAGTYFVRVYETDAPTQSQMYSLSVNVAATGCIAPTITSHPTGDTVCESDTITFTVAATGTAPLTYQWRRNGGNIGGATNSSYTIASIALGDAGNYDCVVSNACGNATSNAAALNVLEGVTITTHPISQTVVPGANVVFTVAATGAAPLSYQWTRNGSPLSDGGNIFGSTGPNLLITNAQVANQGNYACDVFNACGSVTSNIASLTICAGATISSHPASQSACVGSPVTFSVTAGGTGPFTYQWRKNGANIGGATNSSYTIASVVAGDAGNYDVVVTNDCGNATSNVATLSVNTPVSITSQPGSVSVSAGTNVSFVVAASGTGPLTYQWKKNGSNLSDGGNISGATTTTLTITSVTAADAGSYACDVTNVCGTQPSNSATLTVTGGCAGDFNNDGLRDLADLTTLLANFGTPSGATSEQGDIDGDGDVDLADLAGFLAVFGLPC